MIKKLGVYYYSGKPSYTYKPRYIFHIHVIYYYEYIEHTEQTIFEYEIYFLGKIKKDPE